jgi:hypothetical protein
MTYHPAEPQAGTGFGFEDVMRHPDRTRFMDWHRWSSFFASRPAVADTFTQPYAVEAGIEPFDQAA